MTTSYTMFTINEQWLFLGKYCEILYVKRDKMQRDVGGSRNVGFCKLLRCADIENVPKLLCFCFKILDVFRGDFLKAEIGIVSDHRSVKCDKFMLH